jgi:hypothetical protein
MFIREVNIDRREAEKQDADKPEGEKSDKQVDDSRHPTESSATKPTDAYGRSARGTDEQKPEPAPSKPTGDTPDVKKEDEPKSRDK